MGPHPAVAAIRLAVRRVLHDVLNHHCAQDQHGAPLVLVACSGGADSMALASALAFEAPCWASAPGRDHRPRPPGRLRPPRRRGRAAPAGPQLDPVDVVSVEVGRAGGPEAAARDARYAALDATADRHGASAVLPGHTRDDQAETVLLGLARGSGIRSLSGMAAAAGTNGRYRRPFLDVDRQTARTACLIQALPVWDDPTTPIPPTPARDCATRGCPPWRSAWARASWRPWRGPPSCPVTTPTHWTPGPPRPRRRSSTRRAPSTSRGSSGCRPRCAAGCCAGRSSPRVRRPVRSSPGTSRKWTG
ncbi:tRNA lysidine(34) synthetase TilS [Streptomyces albulus]|nr:tRNA lysidine(34) synthetase TilS [Streptomyces noursei]